MRKPKKLTYWFVSHAYRDALNQPIGFGNGYFSQKGGIFLRHSSEKEIEKSSKKRYKRETRVVILFYKKISKKEFEANNKQY
ncbi:MAG: hypothetical protein PHT40_00275 [Patescibacteria group bacterium]|nr:hypothetical protein [Patescibacteria group bacterium]